MSKLLGDMTQEALKAIGADKIAKFYERKTGRACNCAGRRETLNNLHRAAQRMLERQNAQPTPQQLRPPPPKKDVYVAPTKPVDEQ
jgi:hypothetical protein